MARLWQENPTGELVISGPAGTGKTRGILDYIHARCGTSRTRALLMRKTQESLKTSALITYQEQVLYEFDGKQASADNVSYFGGNDIRPAQFNYHDTGSTIVLGGMDNPSKVLSTEYDIIYVNECTELRLDEWETLGGRTDRPSTDPRPPGLLLGDCNPGPPTHWIKQREALGQLKLWPTTHRDNPAMWNAKLKKWTKAGLRYLARLRQYTGVRRLRFLMGVWAAAEGQVYDAWIDSYHVRDRAELAHLLEGAAYFGTADWGWTNPGVLQVWALDYDGRLILVHEVYMTHKPLESFWTPKARALSNHYGFSLWLCDPSEPANIYQFQQVGLDARGAKNDILPGITAAQDRMSLVPGGLPRLMVLKDSLEERDPQLMDAGRPWSTPTEILEYVWARKADGVTLKDKPQDENNHGLDCLRYAVAHVDLGGYVGDVDPFLAAAFVGMPG